MILDTLSKWPDRKGEGWPSWAFSNHDAPRVVSRWGDATSSGAWAKLLLALLMSLRGNVFLYQGEELGLRQAEIPFDRLRDPEAIANWPLTQGRDGARTPMPWSRDLPNAGFSAVEPWLPIPSDHVALAVSAQEQDADSVLAVARADPTRGEAMQKLRGRRVCRPQTARRPCWGLTASWAKIIWWVSFSISATKRLRVRPWLRDALLFAHGFEVDPQDKRSGSLGGLYPGNLAKAPIRRRAGH